MRVIGLVLMALALLAYSSPVHATCPNGFRGGLGGCQPGPGPGVDPGPVPVPNSAFFGGPAGGYYSQRQSFQSFSGGMGYNQQQGFGGVDPRLFQQPAPIPVYDPRLFAAPVPVYNPGFGININRFGVGVGVGYGAGGGVGFRGFRGGFRGGVPHHHR